MSDNIILCLLGHKSYVSGFLFVLLIAFITMALVSCAIIVFLVITVTSEFKIFVQQNKLIFSQSD